MSESSQPAPPAEGPWPPAYTVRVSPKAKHPRLRVLPGAGLEVVLPRHIHPETATEIVERHKDWIRKTLDRVCGNASNTATPEAVPTAVAFRGGKDERPVVCRGETNAAENAIRLRVPRDEVFGALRELRGQVRRHASLILEEELSALSAEHGLPYASVRFRRQRSRWGSCTARGALNLNTCLVFLPPELARHVLLHELAHTRHMNHGQGFWKLLFAIEPEALKLDKRLRTSWRYVPSWIWESP